MQKKFISLSKVYDLICVVIARTSDLNTIIVQEVVESLKSYDHQLNRHVEDAMNFEKLLQAWALLQKLRTSPLFMELLAKQRRIGNQNTKSGKPNSAKWEGR